MAEFVDTSESMQFGVESDEIDCYPDVKYL